jgi:two-component system, LytTR family, sensor kinase
MRPMLKFNERFKKDWVYHVFFWLVVIIPQGVNSVYILRNSTSLYWVNMLVRVGVVLVIIYGNFSILIPHFYKTKRWLAYYTGLLLLLGIFMLQSYFWGGYMAKQMQYKDDFALEFWFYFFEFARNIVISFLLYGLREKFYQEKKMDQVQLEKLTTEINYLKAQINPHFLFNTLNNLYGMALQKSDKTPEVIMRLSKMMDYMLYDSDDAKVYLVKDIENLENYISLENIRQGNNAQINYTKVGLAQEQKIVPLLFLPLVENGFKHGVNELIKGAFLDVHLKIAATSATIMVKNNYKVKTTEEEEKRTGIGLANLHRRLELFYPGKHLLNIRQSADDYEAQLTIHFA